MVLLAQPCTFLAPTLTLSPNGPNKLALEPRDLGVPSGASKMIYEPMRLLAQPCTYLALTLTLSANRPT
jgi:hypothetical protein